ncbi:hypothetical protein Lalb_Chr19g0127661 [Lupinus albus]|uniref:Uncharacterized protein n=1 Tax=Lupinus albus TaxID=3870 RepID=A0A6A4NNK0_LUPAL|nr:hypothetical protein Lalb_Chr19g0127661 [Lupinus albus]
MTVLKSSYKPYWNVRICLKYCLTLAGKLVFECSFITRQLCQTIRILQEL